MNKACIMDTHNIRQLRFGNQALCFSADELLLELNKFSAFWFLVPAVNKSTNLCGYITFCT